MPKSELDILPKNVKRIGFLICLISSLILIILLGFNYQQYFQAQKRFKEKNARLLTLEKDVQGLKESIERSKQERKRLATLLFTDRDIAAFLDKIAEFDKKAQIKITDMQTQRIQQVTASQQQVQQTRPSLSPAAQKKEEIGPQLAALPINMAVEAPFERLVSFLISLEKSRQLLTVSNVSIKRGAYPLLTCRFTLRLYSLKTLEEIYKQ